MLRPLKKYFLLSFLALSCNVEVARSLTGEQAVTRFFEYFRAEDPVGIPVVEFGEPMELYSPLELVPVTLINGRALGHSRLKFIQIFVDLMSLTGKAKVYCPRLEIFGNYSWPSVLYTSEGFMNATMLELNASSSFTMAVDQDSSVQVTDIQFEQESEEVFLILTDLIWEHRMIVSSGAIHFFFDEIAIEIFKQLRPFLISEVNREVSKFISSMPPSKFFFTASGEEEPEEGTGTLPLLLNRLLQYLGLDPLHVPDKTKKILGVKFKITNLQMFGLSSVSRINQLYFLLEEDMIYLESAMRYPRLLLFYDVEMDGGIIGDLDLAQRNRLNDVDITVKMTVDPSQKTPPIITYFDIDVGSFGKIRSGKKSFWGKLVNAWDKFEDSVRSAVIDALQGTLKKILQKELNNLDMENGLLHLLKKK